MDSPQILPCKRFKNSLGVWIKTHFLQPFYLRAFVLTFPSTRYSWWLAPLSFSSFYLQRLPIKSSQPSKTAGHTSRLLWLVILHSPYHLLRPHAIHRLFYVSPQRDVKLPENKGVLTILVTGYTVLCEIDEWILPRVLFHLNSMCTFNNLSYESSAHV